MTFLFLLGPLVVIAGGGYLFSWMYRRKYGPSYYGDDSGELQRRAERHLEAQQDFPDRHIDRFGSGSR